MSSNVSRTLRHLRPRAFDLIKCDATTFAHAAEDTTGCVEEVRRGVELGNLARIEYADPVVTDDGTQPICKEDCQEIELSLLRLKQ